jgi:hypothetical protein
MPRQPCRLAKGDRFAELIGAQLGAEFVPENVGAGVGGHFVDFDRSAIGIERNPADFDDRGPGRDLEAVRLGWQWHRHRPAHVGDPSAG